MFKAINLLLSIPKTSSHARNHFIQTFYPSYLKRLQRNQRYPNK